MKNENLIWEKLKKYGIHNEKELDDAISETILNISCFVTKEGEKVYEEEL